MIEKYVIKNFTHKPGVHCESSTMRDMFEYYGFPMTEARAFGLDGTMGFGFFDYSENFTGGDLANLPIFVGGKQDTINPKSLACKLLGIQLRKQSFTNADRGWEETKRFIKEDTPLMLQVDLGFLDYMIQDDEDFHFGGHFINIGGYDETKGVAYIGESDIQGFQEVKIEDLKRARSSEYGPSFMHPQNTQYSMSVRPDGKHPPLNAGLKLSIKKVVDHMLRPSMSNNGIQGLKNFAESILNWDEKLERIVKNSSNEKEICFARLTFDLIHAYIEEWGTGGALFRNLYKEFLEEIVEDENILEGPHAWTKSEINIIKENLPILAESAHMWTEFAKILKNSVKEHSKECLKHVNLVELSDLINKIRFTEEKLFKNLIEIRI
jgi:hypothetical protein